MKIYLLDILKNNPVQDDCNRFNVIEKDGKLNESLLKYVFQQQSAGFSDIMRRMENAITTQQENSTPWPEHDKEKD